MKRNKKVKRFLKRTGVVLGVAFASVVVVASVLKFACNDVNTHKDNDFFENDFDRFADIAEDSFEFPDKNIFEEENQSLENDPRFQK